MKTRLGLHPVPLLGHISTQHIKLQPKVCKSQSGCYNIYKENVDSCNGNYSGTITSWHNLVSLCKERTKNFHNCPHIQPQSPGCLLHSNLLPLCPFFPTVSPLCPLTLPSFYSLFFHLVSCTSSVFKVQSTKAGCLSPEAVIDRLTKREIEKKRRESGTGRNSEPGQAEKTPQELV